MVSCGRSLMSNLRALESQSFFTLLPPEGLQRSFGREVLKMARLCVLVVVTAIVLAGLDDGVRARSTAAKKSRARPEHPGCLIWWFLEGCPLGRIFGVDPFGIYPWRKFCRRYPAFTELDQCKKYLKQEHDEREPETEAPEAVSPLAQDDEGSYFDLEGDDDAVTFEAVDGIEPRKPKALQESSTNSRLFANCGQQSYYAENVERCRQALKGQGHRQRRETDDLGYLPRHPGCLHFWFLRGCPLGEIFGTDPFDNYPWQTLCLYKDMQVEDQCKALAFDNLN